MSTEFSEARLLELHDAKVRIFPVKCKDELLGWKEYGGCNDTFVIDGSGCSSWHTNRTDI